MQLCLTSPYFKELMMSNVSGVGGSLMRAQPIYVKKYTIPIPPIAEQQRIVDKVNELFTILDNIQNSLDAN
jgi:type I restriction enzyme S subunit